MLLGNGVWGVGVGQLQIKDGGRRGEKRELVWPCSNALGW